LRFIGVIPPLAAKEFFAVVVVGVGFRVCGSEAERFGCATAGGV